MKKTIIIALISVTLFACNNSENQLEHAKKFYEMAQDNLDPSTTQVALTQLILLDSNNIAYKDSLARLYMATGNYKAGVKLGNLVYLNGTASVKMKESLALSYQQLNQVEKAEDLISELWSSTADYKYQYQKLVLTYNKRDLIGFDTLATQILAKIETDSIVANSTVSLPSSVNGVTQDIPLKAAILFIIGTNAFDNEQDVQKAVDYLTKSIQEFNEFEMARYSLQEIERMINASRR